MNTQLFPDHKLVDLFIIIGYNYSLKKIEKGIQKSVTILGNKIVKCDLWYFLILSSATQVGYETQTNRALFVRVGLPRWDY